MEKELKKILNIIESDEYYDKVNEYVKRTLFTVQDIIEYYDDECDLKSLDFQCMQNGVPPERYLSDLIKLLFLGYITLVNKSTDTKEFTLGSSRIGGIYIPKEKKIKYNHSENDDLGFLKLWLDSKISSIKGEDYLTRYTGQTIEEIFKIDPDYIVDKISKNHFIMSLSSIEILERRYKYDFSTSFKNQLKIRHKEYLQKKEQLKKDSQIKPYHNIDINDEDLGLVNQNEFSNYLTVNSIPHKINDGRIIVTSDFFWYSGVKMTNNLTICGNLHVSEMLNTPKLIPNGLKVNGYIQFGQFQFTDDDNNSIEFDSWLKIE
ncbi:hypothetical protein [Aegicerativicinus sediminis]|uniref:hypothetical protein n=1 Tax=Aegicerativicinus sediminis TaxID=2893202 RepID=UPI001E5672CE|nr:hypothetical protein [Aegicerativicinus sediminis]